MNFQPASEDEIMASEVWPPGVYDFSIIGAEEKLSASRGNPMIEVTIAISKNGLNRIVRDYLLAQRKEQLMNAAKACDLLDKYRAGSLGADDFVGKSGSLRLGTQRSKNYPSKNVVLEYITPKGLHGSIPDVSVASSRGSLPVRRR